MIREGEVEVVQSEGVEGLEMDTTVAEGGQIERRDTELAGSQEIMKISPVSFVFLQLFFILCNVYDSKISQEVIMV